MSKKIIDLFSGCGGLSVGFEQAGYKIIKAVEFDEQISKTYQLNHKKTIMLNEDIKLIANNEYFKREEADVIIGGPPCQGFSMAGARIRHTNSFVEDPRNYLFKHYLEVVKIVKPKMFIMENVKGILTMKNGGIFKEIVSSFQNRKNFDGDYYDIQYKVVKGIDCGIPQKRERVIIIGILNKHIDLEWAFKTAKTNIEKSTPFYFDKTNVWDAISNLPSTTKDGIVKNPLPITNYQKYLCCKSDNITGHFTPNHSQQAVLRMSKIKEGQNWEVLDDKIRSVHSGSYGRLEKNGVCATITTRFDTPSGGRFIHPVENRTLTIREAARIQSFPDDFVFLGTKSSMCRQIGNAVPPKIAFYLAKVMEVLIDEYGK